MKIVIPVIDIFKQSSFHIFAYTSEKWHWFVITLIWQVISLINRGKHQQFSSYQEVCFQKETWIKPDKMFCKQKTLILTFCDNYIKLENRQIDNYFLFLDNNFSNLVFSHNEFIEMKICKKRCIVCLILWLVGCTSW